METLSTSTEQAPPSRMERIKSIGPGIVAAATGVGAGDLVATLAAGSNYGYLLLWAVLLGVIVKIGIGEAVGRYHLATNSTLLRGWRSLGVWTSWYFGVYIVVWGFSYGAAIMMATGLPMNALFPALSITQWGALNAIAGLLLVWFGGYVRFERIMMLLIGIKFIVVVGLAIILLPNIPSMLNGIVPRMPAGSLIYTLGLLGGVGGTITLAAYGYWFSAKGWHGPQWLPMMRLDNSVSYIITGVFVIAMMVVGTEILHTAGISAAKGDQALIQLGDILQQRYGPYLRIPLINIDLPSSVIRVPFLVGFWAVSAASLLGVWNGVSLMFSDFVRHARNQPEVTGEASTRTREFRAYALWLTFPPMVLISLFPKNPVQLVLIYGVLGALFMPFLSATLLWLLNWRVEKPYRSGWLSNSLLIVSVLLFGFLCAIDLLKVGQ